MGTSTDPRKRLPIYLKTTPEDLDLSGPTVWPNMSADLPVDRYIHRRPELAYLRALRLHRQTRITNNEPDLAGIRVSVHRKTFDGSKRRHELLGYFVHHINIDNPTEDVRALLKQLRSYLFRRLPDQPLLACSICLRFYDNEKPDEPQSTFQDRWI